MLHDHTVSFSPSLKHVLLDYAQLHVLSATACLVHAVSVEPETSRLPVGRVKRATLYPCPCLLGLSAYMHAAALCLIASNSGGSDRKT